MNLHLPLPFCILAIIVLSYLLIGCICVLTTMFIWGEDTLDDDEYPVLMGIWPVILLGAAAEKIFNAGSSGLPKFFKALYHRLSRSNAKKK